jgi:hypothetical protein
MFAESGLGTAELRSLELDRSERGLDRPRRLKAVSVSLGAVFFSALVAVSVELDADELLHDALEGEPEGQACDLLNHIREVNVPLEQVVDLCADALGGRYSWCHGCGSSFVSWSS